MGLSQLKPKLYLDPKNQYSNSPELLKKSQSFSIHFSSRLGRGSADLDLGDQQLCSALSTLEQRCVRSRACKCRGNVLRTI